MAPNMLSMLSMLSLVLPVAVAQTYSYGCYTEGATERALTGSALVNYANMTVEMCTTYCSSLSYSVWGIEYGGECYCGDVLSTGAVPTFPAECAVACPGNTNETCGGGNHLTLFGNSTTPPPYTPVGGVNSTTLVSLGCYTEGNGTRAFCLDEGFPLFGTEYSSECWCGNELAPSSTAAPASDCYMSCSGNATEICGGPDRLSIGRILHIFIAQI